MAFLFKGDLHLRLRAWESMPAVSGDSFAAANQIAAVAVELGVSALVLGGDNLDVNRPEPDELECLFKMVRLLDRYKIKVPYIQGQHCRGKRMPWPAIIPEPIWLHKQIIEVEPCIFMTGFDNMPGEELKAELAQLDPKVDVLVLHQMAKGCRPDIEGKSCYDFDPEWVPEHVKLVLLGDNHRDWQLVRGKTQFWYSGSACMQSVDEPPQKYVLHISTPEFKVTKLPLKSRPFASLIISDESQVPAYIQQVAAMEADSLVVIKYDPRVQNVEARFNEANKNVHFMWKLMPLEVVQGEIVLDDIRDVSLENCLSKAVDPEQDAEFYQFMLSLLKSNDPRTTLAAHKLQVFGPVSTVPDFGNQT